MINIPFDVSFYIDNELRDVPNNATEMQQAVEFLQSNLNDDSVGAKYQIQLLGLIGGYARMLGDLTVAEKALSSAIKLSESIEDWQLRTVNLIRLAHVYQWQKDYTTSEELFEEAIANCQHDPKLSPYLDFAYQHAGKCKFDQQKFEEALYYFEQAFSLRCIKDDQSLIDSTQLAIDVVSSRLNINE